MNYTYICPNCNKEHVIYKSMMESGRVEKCECGSVMKRVYSGASIKTNDGVKK